ncbi:tRNA uridine-5-carboxymethylaminomethyl(34) synthesis GTPase MnmE [Comamonas sp. NLF-1-9]|uniref:tRNA uridine-5-carboxymethylaminomethyl(34) synthesis GTPase MnmE n=1 Tax=Comamonas sp. NLF-1-9 TaxID=2853163 RepID=UPI001C4607B0|nr:tRNA uridine-5-carboxymethylaminomethyl(34) synthesis GTPase MnmE [Comamonas sp. NLF-1-9]QXL83772.1 tRNA uridine-5-carboxymethylaminomethyl(34) synthesis GTPase MnmE [Comamonas sp. NLF-1-9]
MTRLARHGDPIAAIATAPGRGAVGIVRVSGQGLAEFVRTLLGRAPRPRQAHYLPFPDARGEAIDRGLALWFPAPHSYTGEDVLELQAHGGPVVLQLLLARCLEVAQDVLPRLRLAEPGEFTERAFLNDKLDLAQAEAVADLIDASTETAARSAARSLSGAFSREVETLREALVQLRMLVEATLDFPEEEIDFLRKADARGQLSNLQDQVAVVLGHARQGALLREGITVVIAGQPNVGKSSLLNALAGAELAIVTPIAGTTRDTVRQTIQIEGVPLHVIDTAGLRESSDEVERIGIARAWQQIREADALLFLHDLTRSGDADYERAQAQLAAELLQGPARGPGVIEVWNKVDAAPEAALQCAGAGVVLSARTGQGLADLRRALLQTVGWQAAPEGVFIARERHLQALRVLQQHLHQALQWLDAPEPALDLLAEELRLAQQALGAITGEFTADDLLGTIFSRFCIGK